MNNQLSYWYPGQVVTDTEMTSFLQDLYQRWQFLSNNFSTTGCIINIGTISQTLGNVNVGAGSFMFPTTTYAFLPYNNRIIGNAAAAVVAVTGNGYIVARSSLTPTSSSQTTYTISVVYMFVTSVDTATDCVICVITAGVISGYGPYFINQGATNAQAMAGVLNNVALTPWNLPNISNNNTTGEVRVYTSNTPIAGQTPSAEMQTIKDGIYAHSELVTYSQKENLIYGGIVNNVDANGNPLTSLSTTLSGGGTASGVVISNDGTKWLRPYIETTLPSGLTELGIQQESLLTFFDVNALVSTSTLAAYTLPGIVGSNSILVQTGQFQFTTTASSETFTYAYTYTGIGCISAIATICNTSNSIYVTAIDFSDTAMTVYLNTNAVVGLTICYTLHGN